MIHDERPRRSARTTRAGATLIAALIAVGCGRAGPESASDGDDPTPAAGSQTTKPAPPPAKEIPMKDNEPTAPEALGTLPPDVGVAVGQPAPDAEVERQDGSKVKLRSLIEEGPILLVFYRGGWCPFCNSQIHALTRAYPEYRERGVTPVAISVDRPEEAATTQARYTIPFPVLSDPDLHAHRAYRAIHQADAAEVETLKGYGMDLERASGRTHHVIAVPAIFLIDRAGVVRWAHADPDYKVRPTDAQILAAIDRLELP
jgi:peroxiredoxin